LLLRVVSPARRCNQANRRQGIGLYWEEFAKPSLNPKTGESVTAQRRRIKRDFDLPMKEEYSVFVESLLSRSQS